MTEERDACEACGSELKGAFFTSITVDVLASYGGFSYRHAICRACWKEHGLSVLERCPCISERRDLEKRRGKVEAMKAPPKTVTLEGFL